MMFEVCFADRDFEYGENDVDHWVYNVRVCLGRTLTRDEDNYLRNAITNAAARALYEIKEGCLE